jgi:metal-responsive CopG/Arc/MetJ family transcriptional regulator
MLRMVESERFEMRISPELLAEIDAWAKAQPDKPPRATAVKRLIAMALEAEEKRAKREAKK